MFSVVIDVSVEQYCDGNEVLFKVGLNRETEEWGKEL